jgi:hypothetical protein
MVKTLLLPEEWLEMSDDYLRLPPTLSDPAFISILQVAPSSPLLLFPHRLSCKSWKTVDKDRRQELVLCPHPQLHTVDRTAQDLDTICFRSGPVSILLSS